MRQRKAKDLEARLAEVGQYIIENPASKKGCWKEVFGNTNDIFMELGCGKGQFIIKHALENPEQNYIGIEGQPSVVLRGLEKAKEAGLENLVFVPEFVRDICDFFQDGELAGIYLNFSDPWPKDRHKKRRLTYWEYLKKYKQVLKQDGLIEIKTDNDGLYEFTLEQIKEAGLDLVEATPDLHGSAHSAGRITTEYEDKFRAEGKKINYIKL